MPDWNAFVRQRLALRVRPEREAEIVQELAQQLSQASAELVNAGVPEVEALRRAEAQVGDWAALAREIEAAEAAPRHVEPPPPRMSLWAGSRHDLRYALRFLRKKPVFALVAAGTLAFGIGGNTAMFTIADAVALRGLPYPDADRLMTMGAHRQRQPEIEIYTSAPDFFDLRAHTQAFTALAGISPVWNMVLSGGAEAERLECLFVSANLFGMLGVSPALGRSFLAAEDDGTHGAQVALIGYAYWQRKFGGRTDVLNRPLALDGSSYTIVGVLPAGFRYAGEPLASAPTEIDVWLPLAANPLIATRRSLRFLKVVGRLKDGVSAEQGRDEIRRLGAALAREYPESNGEMAWEVRLLREEALGRYRTPVFLLLGAVGFVLLMASANVANLLLARCAERRQEMAIRVALGAPAFRIVRQLLAESLALAALGGAGGALLAQLLLKVFVAIGPAGLVRSQAIRLDARALLFTAAVVLMAATLSGLAPAWRSILPAEMGNALGGGRTIGAGAHRFRSILVAAQVALALVLLIGAGLLIRSFQRLLEVNPGFQAKNLVTISTQVPAGANSPEQRTAVYLAMRDRLLAIPGVRKVAAVSRLPMMGSDLTSSLFAEGKMVAGAPAVEAQYRRATPDYFATMGIPLRAGRWFDERDGRNNSVALVDEVTARRVWPGEDPIGKRVKLGSPPDAQPWTTIIGVAGSIRHFGLEIAPQPAVYTPYAASPLVAPILVIRTSAEADAMVPALAAAVRSAYPGIPAYNVFAMQTLVDRSTAQRRFLMLLLTAFAAGAMLLAAVGVYGSISHSVAQRTREIGLRMALGASRGAAMRMVLGEGLRLTLAGVAVGWLAAGALTRLMQSVLFGVRPLDPVAFAAAAVMLGCFAILACAAPAWRAARVDPLVALREP